MQRRNHWDRVGRASPGCPGSIIDRVRHCLLQDVDLGVLPVHVYGEISPPLRFGSLVRMAAQHHRFLLRYLNSAGYTIEDDDKRLHDK